MKKLIFLSALFVVSLQTSALVRLPKILSDNMVLQRNKPITLWGWADPNEKIMVTFKQQIKSAKADASGKWIVTLSAESAGGHFQLTFKGKNLRIFLQLHGNPGFPVAFSSLAFQSCFPGRYQGDLAHYKEPIYQDKAK